ncbi:ATP-binding protein [Jannaschia helgolandensis]|uniref:AAA family ATPase n=1 Tax=Jannaschia helgolandensis TaxID=188906 RepID=UPI0030DC2293
MLLTHQINFKMAQLQSAVAGIRKKMRISVKFSGNRVTFSRIRLGITIDDPHKAITSGVNDLMARSDLIVELIKAGVSGNADSVRATAEAIAADERAKKHSGVAERISQALITTPKQDLDRQARGGLRVRDGSGGIQRRDPERPLSELFLEKHTRTACLELIEEQRRADVLRAHGLEPRHRLLLVGPPGNGKTSLAESIAYELSLPLFTVRYDAVVTSYLGETAQRLRRLFDFVRTEPCVLFFDEFDAIGKERGDLHETGEIKRVVTTLLLQLDDLPSYCVLVGATNHPELLDRATWRRFEIKLELGRPSDDQMTEYFAKKLKEFSNKSGFTAKRLRTAIAPKSISEAEDFFLDIHRRYALAQGTVTFRTLVKDRVIAWAAQHGRLGGDDRPTDPASA